MYVVKNPVYDMRIETYGVADACIKGSRVEGSFDRPRRKHYTTSVDCILVFVAEVGETVRIV